MLYIEVVLLVGFLKSLFAAGIVPGIPDDAVLLNPNTSFLKIIGRDDVSAQKFQDLYSKGYASPHQTFNIYNDKIRETTLALYDALLYADASETAQATKWLKKNINHHMLDYVLRLVELYGDKDVSITIPPYITKPNYFVNSETIFKALQLSSLPNKLFPDIDTNGFANDGESIKLPTRYSGWSSVRKECDDDLKYFREDIGLNSYYYGVHLQHPFWMSNSEMERIDPRHAEKYYFVHQQLVARYLLEKEHRSGVPSEECDDSYNPQLVYDNGLPFPSSPDLQTIWRAGRLYLSSIDIAVKEYLSRGIVVASNGTVVNLTEDNYNNLLPQFIRANFDGVKSAKSVRAIYGYGEMDGKKIEDTPAPSVWHHPETSLRDPEYWTMLDKVVKYSVDYKKKLRPTDLSTYKADDYQINIGTKISNITTYFTLDSFNMVNHKMGPKKNIEVQQWRLDHMPFEFEFNVGALEERDVLVSLFLGPKCDHFTDECVVNFHRFYELDVFRIKLDRFINIFIWSPSTSTRFSEDYNDDETNSYNIYKFPRRLLIPRGTEEGMEMTLFVMINEVKNINETAESPKYSSYDKVDNYLNVQNSIVCPFNESRPLGFPFHKQFVGVFPRASNYKFYKIHIFHKNNNK